MFSSSPANVINGHKALCNNRNYRLPMQTVSSMYTKWKAVTLAGDEIGRLAPYAQAIASTSAWFEEELRLVQVRAAQGVGVHARDTVLQIPDADVFPPPHTPPPPPPTPTHPPVPQKHAP